MPKKLINDYIFYEIVCLDDSVDLCYVGSTANWKNRAYNHKSNCHNENSKSYNLKIYKTIRENGGWNNFKMIELGKREQLTKRQAEKIEEDYRKELKANLNVRRCYIADEELKEYQQKYYLEYYQANKEHYQQWYQANKERIKERCEANKEKKKEYDKKRYQLKKIKINNNNNSI